MLEEEMERGWQVMPPKEATLQIESWDIVAPIGMVAQTSIVNRETKATSSDSLTTSHSIPAVRGTRTKRERLGGQVATDNSQIQKGLQPTNLSHHVLT